MFFNSSQLQPLGQGAGLCGWSDGPQRQTVGLTPKLCQSGPHGVRRTASLLHGPYVSFRSVGQHSSRFSQWQPVEKLRMTQTINQSVRRREKVRDMVVFRESVDMMSLKSVRISRLYGTFAWPLETLVVHSAVGRNSVGSLGSQ